MGKAEKVSIIRAAYKSEPVLSGVIDQVSSKQMGGAWGRKPKTSDQSVGVWKEI